MILRVLSTDRNQSPTVPLPVCPYSTVFGFSARGGRAGSRRGSAGRQPVYRAGHLRNNTSPASTRCSARRLSTTTNPVSSRRGCRLDGPRQSECFRGRLPHPAETGGPTASVEYQFTDLSAGHVRCLRHLARTRDANLSAEFFARPNAEDVLLDTINRPPRPDRSLGMAADGEGGVLRLCRGRISPRSTSTKRDSLLDEGGDPILDGSQKPVKFGTGFAFTVRLTGGDEDEDAEGNLTGNLVAISVTLRHVCPISPLSTYAVTHWMTRPTNTSSVDCKTNPMVAPVATRDWHQRRNRSVLTFPEGLFHDPLIIPPAEDGSGDGTPPFEQASSTGATLWHFVEPGAEGYIDSYWSWPLWFYNAPQNATIDKSPTLNGPG